MIPSTTTTDSEYEVGAEEFESYPTLTYRLDFVNKRIMGKVDNEAAVVQFIRKVLDTSKYDYEIYDWYYGNELLSLVGKPYEYIIAEIPRIIEEALLVDDRIISIDSWAFNKISVDAVEVSFMVYTIYGTLKYVQEVSI